MATKGVMALACNGWAQVLSGVAGLVGGALSMAAGEYISVYSQKDSQDADIAKERDAQQVSPFSQHLQAALWYHRWGTSSSWHILLDKEIGSLKSEGNMRPAWIQLLPLVAHEDLCTLPLAPRTPS